MKEQDVITLDDGKEYLLLDELKYENKKYFFSVEIDEKGVTQEDKGGIFLKATKENNEEYVEVVESPILLEKLFTLESVSMAMQYNEDYRKEMERLVEKEQKGGN